MSFFARLKGLGFTAALMLIMILVRVLYGSATELRAGQEAVVARDFDRAILHLERSLHWYVPFSPTITEAAQQLWEIGQNAEAQGNGALALEAYQALRGAFYATRSFYTPHPAWIARANDRIATLQARDGTARWPDPSLSETQRKTVALEALTRDDAPEPGWSIIAVLGFLGWVGAAVGVLLQGFDAEGRFLRPLGARWGIAIVVGYALWVVGLMRA